MNKFPLLIVVIFYWLSYFCFGKIYHGAGMQMTWNRTDIYYKRFCSFDNNIQLDGDVGLHFEESQYRLNRDRFYNYQTIFLDLTAGYHHSLFLYKDTKPFKDEDFSGIWRI